MAATWLELQSQSFPGPGGGLHPTPSLLSYRGTHYSSLNPPVMFPAASSAGATCLQTVPHFIQALIQCPVPREVFSDTSSNMDTLTEVLSVLLPLSPRPSTALHTEGSQGRGSAHRRW